jgi:small-conductance mechanosensitive channel
MFDTMFQELINWLRSERETFNALLDGDQVIILGVIFLLAWLSQPFLQELFNPLGQRLLKMVWPHKFIGVMRSIALPLTVKVLDELALALFRTAPVNISLLEVASRLITLWIIYRLGQALLKENLTYERAYFWSQKVLRPLLLFVAVLWVLGLLTPLLAWGVTLGQSDFKITIGSLIFGTVTMLAFIFLAGGIRHFFKDVFLPQAGAEPALTQAISALVSYAFVIVGVGLALNVMGIDLTILTVIAGGLSVGLGFGLQEIINNFISGFILLFERSLGPGDVIQIADNVGVVQNVAIRSVTIKTRDDIELIVPNSYFLTEIVTNLTRSKYVVRTHIAVSVSYKANPREVEAALFEAAAKHPQALATPSPRVRLEGFGDNGFEFELLVWTDQVERLPGFKSDMRHYIWEALTTRHIEIPFPQRDVHLPTGLPWAELTPTSKNAPS